MVDDGHAIHYTAVARGTPVYASDGVRIGTVDQVVDNYREHILDGIVVKLEGGELKFVDGPEVRRTAERGVTVTFEAAEASEHLHEPESGAGVFHPSRATGRLSRLFGRPWRRK